MKAVVQERCGPPDVLRLVDTGRPEVGPGGVLVRVRAAALNPYDWHIMRGDPLIARRYGWQPGWWRGPPARLPNGMICAAARKTENG
jgi:NADPH:quinone reductase-like Zn-dependent oxidoreductase